MSGLGAIVGVCIAALLLAACGYGVWYLFVQPHHYSQTHIFVSSDGSNQSWVSPSVNLAGNRIVVESTAPVSVTGSIQSCGLGPCLWVEKGAFNGFNGTMGVTGDVGTGCCSQVLFDVIFHGPGVSDVTVNWWYDGSQP